MPDSRPPLWPYSVVAALLALPGIWIALFVVLAIAQQVSGWPGPGVDAVLSWAVLLAGAVPLTLVVLDFFSTRGAVVDIRGVKIDFGRAAPAAAAGLRMPDNVGIPGNVVPDSSPMQIVGALQTASRSDVAIVDLGSGGSWWVTRLMALSAGAARAGRPSVIVFVGREAGVDGRFLGFSRPDAIVRAITAAEDAYDMALREAGHITLQVQVLARHPPQNITPDPIVDRYLSDPAYTELGDSMLEQILMDQLLAIENQDTPLVGAYPDYPRAPGQPDRLTIGRLRDLLAAELVGAAVEVESDAKTQLDAFMRLDSDYVALTRGRIYESLVRREAVESLVLRQLVSAGERAPG